MRQVSVTGGDLFHVALQYLGDATQFNRIIQANSGSSGGPPMDPMLTGLVTLNIPSVNPLATGGVLVS
jgi:hypothetical protein